MGVKIFALICDIYFSLYVTTIWLGPLTLSQKKWDSISQIMHERIEVVHYSDVYIYFYLSLCRPKSHNEKVMSTE